MGDILNRDITLLFGIGILCLILLGCSGSSSTGTGQQKGVQWHDERLKDAYKLLDKCPEDKAFVTKYIAGSVSGPGTYVLHDGHRGVITFDPPYLDNSSVEWQASVMVHEAEHVRLNHYRFDPVQEVPANTRQLRTLRCVGGAAHEIEYLEGLIH